MISGGDPEFFPNLGALNFFGVSELCLQKDDVTFNF